MYSRSSLSLGRPIISKSGWKKVEVTICGKSEDLMYRVVSCNGVKVCPVPTCDYVAPFTAQRPHSAHTSHKLIRSKEVCSVQFTYLCPQEFLEDSRRWIFAYVRQQNVYSDSS